MQARVLIVDDLPFMRQAIRESLERSGFLIAGEAADGREGILLFRELKPDIVVLDISMPVMDGISALRRIMKLDPTAIVVMCSALGQQDMIVRAIQFGAKDFVVKPFRAERIVSALRRALGSSA